MSRILYISERDQNVQLFVNPMGGRMRSSLKLPKGAKVYLNGHNQKETLGISVS